jgi:hypothetical protein
MFDNLRDQATDRPFYKDEAQFQQGSGVGVVPPLPASSRHFLGMTASQRFMVAAMLMIIVCVLGAMLLLATGRIGFV